MKTNGVVKLRKHRARDLFIFLARTLIGQQLSKTAARTIWSRLECLAAQQEKSIFDVCIKRSANKIHSCGVSKNKVVALIELRRSFACGRISYESIAQESGEGIARRIKQLHGFGQWSADMVAMFFLSHPDVWPTGDAALIRGMRLFVGGRRIPAKAALLYRPYRTYLARHVWSGLDAGIVFES